MEITNLKTKHVELTDDLADYLQTRLDSCDKFLPDSENIVCDVEVAKTTEHHQQGKIYYAEANLEIEGEQYYASAEAESVHAAIDVLKDELHQKLRARKQKRLQFMKRGGRVAKNFIRGFGSKFKKPRQ